MSARHISSIFRKGLFNNKVAIVTGGATGIGRAITEELIYLGCKVVIASRNEEKLLAATEEIKELAKAPSEIKSIKCNVRSENEVKDLIKTTLQLHGKLDFLVNNGGGQFMSTASDITLKGWHAVLETNLTGTFLLCKEAYNQWMKDHRGAIVNMLMDMNRGAPFMAHSGAARAGIQNLTKTLAVEWAEKGVRVNAVAPGTVYSETAAKNYSANIFDAVKERLPSKRCGTPAEVSAAVCFLLSPAASFITGESICVDCGQNLYSAANWIVPDHDNLPPFPSNL